MKKINIYKDDVNEDWYPPTHSAGNKKNPKMRILTERYRIILPYTRFTTPYQYYTDLASVPRIFWNITPPYGVDDLAFVVHDYLYWKQIGSRKEADKVLKYIQSKLGAPKWRVSLMYLILRVFGTRWKKSENEK